MDWRRGEGRGGEMERRRRGEEEGERIGLKVMAEVKRRVREAGGDEEKKG